MRSRRRWLHPLVVVSLVLLSSIPAWGQPSREEFESLKSEVGVLRDAIKNQTEILRQVLERLDRMAGARDARDGALPASISVDRANSYGRSDAKVTIVEFSDYQCPFCARHSNETFPQLDREYIQTGRLKYVFQDFPIEAAHPHAFKAHEAVHCAAEQGKRREMHEKVFSNQRKMTVADLTAHAVALGLDKLRFDTCLESGKHSATVRNAMNIGQQAGVRGTPTFFIGLTEPDGANVKPVRRVIGAQPYSAFKAAIDELLSAK